MLSAGGTKMKKAVLAIRLFTVRGEDSNGSESRDRENRGRVD